MVSLQVFMNTKNSNFLPISTYHATENFSIKILNGWDGSCQIFFNTNYYFCSFLIIALCVSVYSNSWSHHVHVYLNDENFQLDIFFSSFSYFFSHITSNQSSGMLKTQNFRWMYYIKFIIFNLSNKRQFTLN